MRKKVLEVESEREKKTPNVIVRCTRNLELNYQCGKRVLLYYTDKFRIVIASLTRRNDAEHV